MTTATFTDHYSTSAFAGIPITVNVYACKREFVGWRRRHRRKRVRLKWRKKYGAVMVCKGQAWDVRGMGIVCCPCVSAALLAWAKSA